MPHLTRFALLLACALGMGSPSSSEAGVIPWTYNAIFGPPGSLHGTYYTPYYSGGYGYTGGGYLPASYSAGYGAGNCSSCQSSYYSASFGPCGCSPCGAVCSGNCSTGNCASGNCSSGNCTVNSAPNGSLTPTADPYNSSRSIESRLEAIEKQLNIVPPREPSPRPSTYESDSFRSRTRPRANDLPADGLGEAAPIPARDTNGTGTRRGTTGTVIEDEPFSTPDVRTPARGGTSGTDDGMFHRNAAPRGNTEGTSNESRETFKANTEKANADKSTTEGAGDLKSADPDLVIPEKKPVPTGSAVDDSNGPQTLRLDSRITTKAVSPRERQSISVDLPKPAVVRTKPIVPSTHWAGNPRAIDLAQHR